MTRMHGGVEGNGAARLHPISILRTTNNDKLKDYLRKATPFTVLATVQFAVLLWATVFSSYARSATPVDRVLYFLWSWGPLLLPVSFIMGIWGVYICKHGQPNPTGSFERIVMILTCLNLLVVLLAVAALAALMYGASNIESAFTHGG